jgi:hypothetical protein
MVLGRFVDADVVPLLLALAGGRVFVTPSIIEPQETPPFVQQPIAEFAKGIFAAQRDLSRSLHAVRVQRRTAFYQAMGVAWTPVALSPAELQQAQFFASRALQRAKAIDPTIKSKRVDGGEAECAAVAVMRGWALWTDDRAIIDVLATLYPGHRIERISDLFARAVLQGFIKCRDAADLYNNTFVGQLGLYSRISLYCKAGKIVAR